MKERILYRIVAGVLAVMLVLSVQPPWRVSAESEGENVLAEQEESAALDEENGDSGEILAQSEETKELTVPQNLRYENGDIVWNEVKDAYGYCLRTYVDDSEKQYTYYKCSVELDRLCYEENMDFGEYRFEVCSFDESNVRSEWSDSVTATYAPALATPANVRLSEEEEETVLWDEIEGATRYNIRILNNDDERTLYTTTYAYDCSYTDRFLGDSGNYWISVQALDMDYNVSEWTEPILFSHTAEEKLGTPQNVRLDESGENILWDEVEGATYYSVDIDSLCEKNGSSTHAGQSVICSEAQFSNWKFYTCPPSNGQYVIRVYAYNEQKRSNESELLTVTYDSLRDESIELPEEIRLESSSWSGGSWFEGDGLEDTNRYWLVVLVNDDFLDSECYSVGKDWATEIGYRLPAANYDVELFAVNQNGNYNSKTYTLAIGAVSDETVWVPKILYKFETLLWDYDRLRHDKTFNFWIRIKKGDAVVKLTECWSEFFYGLPDLPNGDYTVEVCVYQWDCKIGPWSEPLNVTVFDGSLFDKENEVSTEVGPSLGAAEVPEEDRITSITINPAFNMKHKDGNDVELDLTKIKIKANEIYDEEGLRRAEEALGQELKGNKHYNLLDLTLLYDGDDFSNGYEGLVQVIIPIPAGHRDKTFSCYRLTEVDGKMVKEEIPGEQTEDSYIIYLEHFSEYALVADGGEGEGEEEHTHAFADSWINDENGHWKECECGEKSEEADHTYGEWEIFKKATETEEGIQERSCEVCGYKQTESVSKLTPSTPPEPSKPSTPSAPSQGDEKPVESETPSVSIVPIDPESNDGKAIVAEAEVEARKGIASYEEVQRIAQYDVKCSATTPENPLTLSLAIPDIAVNDKIIVMHKTASGWVQEKNVKLTANGTVQVTVTSCSPFVFYKVTGYDGWAGVSASAKAEMMNATKTGAASPKTGDAGVIGFMLIAAACGAGLVFEKKKLV